MVVFASHWPSGRICQTCGGSEQNQVKIRGLFQWTACRRQTSAIAGTIFASTKLPLRTWFHAMYQATQTKQGISSLELGRRLGVSQTTEWERQAQAQTGLME